MALQTREGDLIALAKQGDFDVIAHGCNCMCTMGAGIAKQINAHFPDAYAVDLKTKKADRSKLGTCSVAKIANSSGGLTIVNAYTQFDWRGSGMKLDYDALEHCMQWIAATFPQKRIGIPRIGAGLAGGDWDRVHHICAGVFANANATIVEYQPG